MDKYDRALLAALIDNGRLTFAELARRINLSPPAVADRVAKLEAEGVITGYHASVNLAKLGLPIECVIELRITEKDCQSVLDELARIPQLTLCHRITGDACVLMKAAVASMPELQDLIDRLMKFGISKTSMILSTPLRRPPAGKPPGAGRQWRMCGVSPSPGLSGRRRDPYLHRRHEPKA
ncbi:Lrp/AsnC family transcriptional regulator [Pseudomonas aeruginosa]|nr:Lrp/AsnC family transcriptional regulator [Pseudomonas aeruginosa]